MKPNFRLANHRYLCPALMILLGSMWMAWPMPRLMAQLPDATAKFIWYGEMDAGIRVFRFLVTASPVENGKWQGELQSLDEGGAKFKLEDFEFNDQGLAFQLKQTKAAFQGKYKERTSGKPDSIDGSWSQGGANLPLEFNRVEGAPADPPSETWIGEMQAGPQKLTVQFRVYREADGTQRAFMDSVSQRAGGFKAELKADGDTVTIDVRPLQGKFTGKRSSQGDEIIGKWNQGVDLDLVLRLAKEPLNPEIDPPKRPQNPIPPFPYDSEEVEFQNISAGISLSGTLTIPHSTDSTRRFPVAVLISGSGPQDRDETLMGHKPFWVLADYLTRRGIAVLRYDERGVGKSTGEFSSATTADFAQDTASAVDFLTAHPRVDSRQIGLIGHSEGGLVAPLVASQRDDVAWIVLMAGPGVNGEQIMYSQGKLMIEAEGGDEAAVIRNRLVQEIAIREIKKLTPGASISELVEPVTDQVIAETLRLGLDGNASSNSEDTGDSKNTSADALPAKGMVSPLVRANLQAMNSVWFRFFMAHEPGPVLEKVQCPVLAINGEKDTQVDPKLNLPKIEESLKRGGNQEITLLELPGLNHLFQTCERGALSEYEIIEETIAPLALKTIGDWIENRR